MAWWMMAAALVSSPQDGTAMAPPAACPTTPAPLPSEYAGWTAMTPLAAGADAKDAAALTLGHGARAMLLPTAGVVFAAAMRHTGTPAQFAGNLTFVAPRAGRYRVALGAAAWIDIAAARAPTQALPSVAHGHGPDCTGIRKIVDFDLASGPHVLQIAGNDAAALGVMVMPIMPSPEG